jgi:hypothetical protein
MVERMIRAFNRAYAKAVKHLERYSVREQVDELLRTEKIKDSYGENPETWLLYGQD